MGRRVKVPDLPLKPDCTCCGGTMTQPESRRQSDGSMGEWKDVPCLASGTAQEIWDDTLWLLRQFINCKADRDEKGQNIFDPDHPERGTCEGCQYEREEILNHLYHYGLAVAKETDERS